MLIFLGLVFLSFYLRMFKKPHILRRELTVEVVTKSASYHNVAVAQQQDQLLKN